MLLSELTRQLRHAPLLELGPITWKAAEEIERLVFLMAEFALATEEFDQQPSEESAERLRLAKNCIWKEALGRHPNPGGRKTVSTKGKI